MAEIRSVFIKKPEGVNVIIGQAHFIKSAEDIYEAVFQSSPQIKFGLAFSEASGACLVRVEGNDDELKKVSAENCLELGCGHCFILMLKEGYPINVLNALKMVPEVCNINCATANLIEVIVAKTALGAGILGIIDGEAPKAIEKDADARRRKELLRKIGYKL